MAMGSATASTAGTTVNLYGSLLFSNANYRCSVTLTGAATTLRISSKTTSSFVVTSAAGTPTFDYLCFGN